MCKLFKQIKPVHLKKKNIEIQCILHSIPEQQLLKFGAGLS